MMACAWLPCAARGDEKGGQAPLVHTIERYAALWMGPDPLFRAPVTAPVGTPRPEEAATGGRFRLTGFGAFGNRRYFYLLDTKTGEVVPLREGEEPAQGPRLLEVARREDGGRTRARILDAGKSFWLTLGTAQAAGDPASRTVEEEVVNRTDADLVAKHLARQRERRRLALYGVR